MLSTLFLLFASEASAYPGMGSPDFHSFLLNTRQAAAGASTSLIGDLATLPPAQYTPTGAEIASILTGVGTGQTPSSPEYIPQPLNTQACAADTCCVWHYIAIEMEALFRGSSGRCNSLARQAVRLGFRELAPAALPDAPALRPLPHDETMASPNKPQTAAPPDDAAGWSLGTGPSGGADGSLLLATEEMTRPENKGLEEIAVQMRRWYASYGPGSGPGGAGVTMADLIQFGSITATVVCPLGPRVRFFSGRPDSSAPAPRGLIPAPTEGADQLVGRFRNMTIEPAGLVALLGAHTTAQQRFVDPARAGDPLDSTVGVWDTLYYGEVRGSAPPRVFKFQSDINLANAFTPVFQAFTGPAGQAPWNAAYANEYVRMSLLGVQNLNGLIECTKVLPAITPSYTPPDKSYVDEWLSTDRQSAPVTQAMMDGYSLSTIKNIINGLFIGIIQVGR